MTVTFNALPTMKGMRMPSLTALEIQTQDVLTLSSSQLLRPPYRSLQILTFCLHQA